MRQKRGLRYALDYIDSFGVCLVPEDIHKRAGLDIMVHTLAHCLRRAARQGKVRVSYKPDNSGTMIAYYSAMPKPRAVYFFTLDGIKSSPYYDTIEELKQVMGYTPGRNIWTGSHEAPILWGGK